MSLPAAFLSEDQFSCSICLEIFNNPVSTPCGHSYCQSCISFYWDTSKKTSGGSKSYQCPLCKETFQKRPDLQINRTLKEITEHFKRAATSGVPMDGKTVGQASPMNRRGSLPNKRGGRGGGGGGGGEMPEGVINEMLTRFQKLSTDQGHHNEPPPPYPSQRRYTVTSAHDHDPNLPLCPVHQRGLAFFCRVENMCICSSCVETAEHKEHNIIPAKREWHIKKSQLGIVDADLKALICERENKVQEINSSLQDIKAAAERETDAAVTAFRTLSANADRCQAEILEVIEMSRRAAEHKAQKLLQELEEEISELKKRSAGLTQLAQTQNYVQFLTVFSSMATLPQTKDWSSTSVGSELMSGVILRNMTQTMERFQEEMSKLTDVWKEHKPEVDQPLIMHNPKVRRVQEFAADITMDPNTAHPRLVISVDGKQVCCGERHQTVPDNPERFDRVVCVLAREGFDSGRHYWEVEVGGKTDWDLGVASRCVCRKGKITVSPAHGYWFLSLRDRTDYAFRTEPSTSLQVSARPSRIGIYVDYEKGIVSFYNVDAKVLIYTFTDHFTDVILPFFSPCTNKSGRNEAPLVICPLATIE